MGKAYRTMKRKVNGKVREVRGNQVVMELPLPMAEVLMGLTDAIERISRDAGLMLINSVMESECTRIAGVKHSKNPNRLANWWGQDDGHVYFDGKTIPILKPRLRGNDKKEIPLKTYKMLQNPDGIKEAAHRKIILGLSSRNYEEASESFLKGYGIKKSSISRSFVKATAGQLKEFLERDLNNLSLCAIYIDGKSIKGEMLVVALGIDTSGVKHVLGIRQGATENSAVCVDLIEDMVRRGLDSRGNYLFVLDGAKALRSAVTRVFGVDVHIQRCQVHKKRNVIEYLSKAHRAQIGTRISKAYDMKDYDEAKSSLELTVRYLEKLNPSAAASLKEGLEETLTLHKLGITGLLQKSLCSTNPIESCFSSVGTITGRVKRWRNGDMVQRWAVSALLRAESKFKRIKGYTQIPSLLVALAKKNIDRKELAA